MNELDKFADIFSRRLEGVKQAQLRFAVCKSVDWNEKTMTAVGVSDDVPYEGVQLGFGFMDIKPNPDTVCLIGILEGKEALTFLINAEEVELAEVNSGTIEINGGKFGGLVKIQELTDKLNALADAFNSHTHTVATTGTAAAQSGTAAATMARVQRFNKSDYENEKIKQ
jgi:predicted transcriptional regulator